MPVSRRTLVLRHILAMQMILILQEGGTGDPKYPNLDLIADPKRNRLPVPASFDEIKYGLEHLQDLLLLVDRQVYEAFCKLVAEPDSERCRNVRAAIHTFSEMSKWVTETSEAEMWCGPDGHPSAFIMREVIADLLKDVCAAPLEPLR